MAPSKAEFRKEYLQRRGRLTENEKVQLDRELADRFFASMDLQSTNWLHTYLPRTKTNEPDTWLIVDRLQKEFPHVHLAVPRMGSDETLEHVVYGSNQPMKLNSLGIPEPEEGAPADILQMNVVIVPLLIADLQGHRLGYGRGYYDRFLPGLSQGCIKLGLSYFPPLDRLPTDPWDVSLDVLVTPEKSIFF